MGEHETWFHLLPGLRNLEATLVATLGDGWLFHSPAHGEAHVFMAAFIALVLLWLGLRYRAQLQAAGDEALIPARAFGVRALVETVASTALALMTGVMGEKHARQYLPLIGGLAFFILFANLAGLFPGFLPATDVLETTAACATIVFVTTHVHGVRAHGLGHFKHMMGPVLWLAPLVFLIELVSHLARPLSLSLRLMGNMVGDHMVLAIFLGLVPLFIPIPIMLLGVIVCVVQTLVFCLLSTVYIALAIEESEEHAHEAQAH